MIMDESSSSRSSNSSDDSSSNSRQRDNNNDDVNPSSSIGGLIDDDDMDATTTSGSVSADGSSQRSVIHETKQHFSKDSQQVVFWMTLVMIMIAVTAGVVITLVLDFTRADSEEQFRNAFDQASHVIDEAVKYHTRTIAASLEAIAIAITSNTGANPHTDWPFVTLPDYEMRSKFVLKEADMEVVAFSPIVPPEDREGWKNYTTSKSKWMKDVDASSGFTGDIYQADPDTGVPIIIDDDDKKKSKDALPLWMTNPRPNDPSIINYDLLSDPVYAALLQSILDDPHTKFSEVFSNDYLNQKGYKAGQHDQLHSHHYYHQQHQQHTHSTNNQHHPQDDGHHYLRRRNLQLTERTEIQVDGMSQTDPMKRRRLQEPQGLGTEHGDNTAPGIQDDDNEMHDHDHIRDDDSVSDDHQHQEKESNRHPSSDADTHNMANVASGSSGEADIDVIEGLADTIPHSVMITPVWDSFDETTRTVVGVVFGILAWDLYLNDLLPEGVNGIVCIVANSCGQSYTFFLHGPHAEFLANDDTHDPKFEDMALHIELDQTYGGGSSSSSDDSSSNSDDSEDFYNDKDKHDYCHYTLTIYPSEEFAMAYKTEDSTRFIALLLSVFAILALFFFIFLFVVQRRQKKVVKLATRTTAIVSSLFPEAVRERILQQAAEEAKDDGSDSKSEEGGKTARASRALRGILNEVKENTGLSIVGGMAFGRRPSGNKINALTTTTANTNISVLSDAPIADLYPECTVGFFDLVGFTAWSSTRDPPQVFVLLETLYGAFDSIAKRRRVFKVETIGDCYVAVVGLPVSRRDHAIVMTRFARECLAKSTEVFHHLEITLGPGTSALNLRLGLHSGPVTAGVLRGEKGRYQIFGDTVNTAARMESNSATGKIHCSKETAGLIRKAGKGSWLLEREDRIVAKGKGALQTFWIEVTNTDSASVGSNQSDLSSAFLDMDGLTLIDEVAKLALNPCRDELSDGHMRMVNWNVELLSKLLQNIVASRSPAQRKRKSGLSSFEPKLGQTPFDEWAQAIDLPEKSEENADGSTIELSSKVVEQLRLFVFNIACLHGQNAFHNFDHASHVTLSTHKLLTRVIQSGDDSYRVASDPLVHFAATLSALIHDVDHRGVPNEQLMKESPQLESKYSGKSVAEQHAIDLSWFLLMKEDFEDLRETIYTTEAERQRFRTILVNSVLSTDIVNTDLKALRNERWALAFSEGHKEDADRYRASSVLEHLIQASDVSHTMQHWHVYRSWNEKLFLEMYSAYVEGRSETDPALNWYEGELGFFDFYIIPLGKKLAEVGVFGVSSHEYLDFAQKNRDEWATRGEAIVAEMLQRVSQNARVATAATSPSDQIMDDDGSCDSTRLIGDKDIKECDRDIESMIDTLQDELKKDVKREIKVLNCPDDNNENEWDIDSMIDAWQDELKNDVEREIQALNGPAKREGCGDEEVALSESPNQTFCPSEELGMTEVTVDLSQTSSDLQLEGMPATAGDEHVHTFVLGRDDMIYQNAIDC